MAAASAASAQVTLSGNFAVVADSLVSGEKNVALDDARLRFATSEDLGGGLKLSASALIEAAGGRNASVVGQDWTLAIEGPFGKITAKNYLNQDAILGGASGVSTNKELGDAVKSGKYTRNRIYWDVPALPAGFSAGLYWDEDAKAAAKGDDPLAVTYPDGTTADLAVSVSSTGSALSDKANSAFDTTKWDIGYATGPFSVGLSGDSKNDFTDYSVSYDAGFANFTYWASQDGNDQEVVVTAPLTSALKAGFHWLDHTTAEGYAFQVTYALSKRTALSFNYTDVDRSTYVSSVVGDNYRVKLNTSF